MSDGATVTGMAHFSLRGIKSAILQRGCALLPCRNAMFRPLQQMGTETIQQMLGTQPSGECPRVGIVCL